jgi:hypothetical protein
MLDRPSHFTNFYFRWKACLGASSPAPAPFTVAGTVGFRVIVGLMAAGFSACSAADAWLVTADAGVLIPQHTSGQATLTAGSVNIPQDISNKVDLANRFGLTVLHRLGDPQQAQRWSWVVGVNVVMDRYDVQLTTATEQEHLRGRNFGFELLVGPTLNLTRGWDLAILGMGGGAYGAYDDTVERSDLSSVSLDGQVRGWVYGGRLLTTLAVLDHMRLGGWVGYEIAHLNQYGPATIDLGPNWPFPTGRVSTGYVDADVVTQGWVLGITLGYGW